MKDNLRLIGDIDWIANLHLMMILLLLLSIMRRRRRKEI
jgi:hypothetical protein